MMRKIIERAEVIVCYNTYMASMIPVKENRLTIGFGIYRTSLSLRGMVEPSFWMTRPL
jgi:precorrin-3B methylase